MLTDEQCAHFEAFGFLLQRQMFSPQEMDLIIQKFEEVMLEARGDKPFGGQQRLEVQNWYLKRPEANFRPDDPRILQPIVQLLGPDFILDRNNDSNYYVGDTPWHADEGWSSNIPAGKDDPYRHAGNMPRHYVPAIKVAFYLDPVNKDTGCLRVIPGSNHNPFHDQLWSLSHFSVPESEVPRVRPQILEKWTKDGGDPQKSEQWFTDKDLNLFGSAPRDIPAFAIESEPGDAVFFSHMLWHASFGGRAGRRMFTVNYGAPLPEK